MFKNWSLLFIFCLSAILLGQEKQQFIEVQYEATLELDADQVVSQVPAAFRGTVEAQLRQEIKDGVKLDYLLKTNGKESLYKLVPRISNNQGQVGLIAQQVMSQDGGDFYKNLENNTYLKEYNIMGQKYLEKDSLQDFHWKMSRDKEQIAGFETRKAVGTMNDTIGVTVWYAPKLTIKDGPDRVFGLPGLILKADFDMSNVKVHVIASNVMVKEEEIKIEKPTDGKVLNEKEFAEEMKALQERMKEMMGGGVETDD